MNFRRGFFRFWVLASAIWIAAFGVLGASDVFKAITYWTGTATVQISTANDGTSLFREYVPGMVIDVPKIKRNIQRMIDQSAPETEIDAYVASEGVTPEELRNDTKAPSVIEIEETLVFPVDTPIEKVHDSIRQGLAEGKVTIRTNLTRLDRVGRALRKVTDAGKTEDAAMFAKEIERIRSSLLPVQQAAYDELVRRGAIGTESSASKYKIVEMPPAFYHDVTKIYLLQVARMRLNASEVLSQIVVVLLVPLLVLFFGWSVAWMLRGFRQT